MGNVLKLILLICFFPNIALGGEGKGLLSHWEAKEVSRRVEIQSEKFILNLRGQTGGRNGKYKGEMVKDSNATSEDASYGSVIYLSNIADHELQVEVKIFQKNGENNYDQTIFKGFSREFKSIEPLKSAKIIIAPGKNNFGFAVIEWKNMPGQNENDSLGLVGYAEKFITGKGEVPLPSINNGFPF